MIGYDYSQEAILEILPFDEMTDEELLELHRQICGVEFPTYQHDNDRFEVECELISRELTNGAGLCYD